MGWKIGVVIKKTGLTARALHFYEASGLIGPIERTVSGHRLYTSKDLSRLQQIKSLKLLGIPLPQIKRVLQGDNLSLKFTVEQLVVKVKAQQLSLKQLMTRLNQLTGLLDANTQSSDEMDDLLFKILETMTMYENYVDSKTIEAIHNQQHQDEQGNETTLAESWTQWCESLKTLMNNNVPPDDSSVQTLMQHFEQLLLLMSEGDKSKQCAFNDLLHKERQARLDHGIDDNMFAFMANATAEH